MPSCCTLGQLYLHLFRLCRFGDAKCSVRYSVTVFIKFLYPKVLVKAVTLLISTI